MGGVDLTSVGRSHSFLLAEALAELGILRTFHTGVFMPGGRRTSSVTRFLPNSDKARLNQRTSLRVPTDAIRSYPTMEIIEQLGLRASPAGMKRSWNYAVSSLFDRRVSAKTSGAAVVHAFEHSAQMTLAAARRRSQVTVLEQPIIHIDSYRDVEEQVRRRTGLAPIRRAKGYEAHVRRKHCEYELADYCFVGLPSAKETMVKHGFAHDRVFVTPYGLPPTFIPAERPPTLDGILRVLFVGHLDFYKGLDVILDAWDLLPDSGFELTVIGLADAGWREYFLRRIDRTPNATYRQPIPASEMPKIYATHDVLAFPSLVGGVGFATLEALVSGVVAVVPDDEGVLRSGLDCLVASPNSPRMWADSLIMLGRDPVLRSRLAAEGVAAAKRLSFSSYASSVRAAYSAISEREGLESVSAALATASEAS